MFVQGRDLGCGPGRRHRRGAHQPDDPAVPRQLALDPDHRASRSRWRCSSAIAAALGDRPDAQHHDAWAAWRWRSASWSTTPPSPSRTSTGIWSRARTCAPPSSTARSRSWCRPSSRCLHLHRLRADVLAAGRRGLPVRADGRGGGVRHDRLLHPVAHPGADDGDVSAEAARLGHAQFALEAHGHGTPAQRVRRATRWRGSSTVRAALRAGPRRLSRRCWRWRWSIAAGSSSAFWPSSWPRSCCCRSWAPNFFPRSTRAR